jgi:hypothetical protein
MSLPPVPTHNILGPAKRVRKRLISLIDARTELGSEVNARMPVRMQRSLPAKHAIAEIPSLERKPMGWEGIELGRDVALHGGAGA